MKRFLITLVLVALILPVSVDAAARRRRSQATGQTAKVYPMMMGPRISTTVIPVSDMLEPTTISGEMLLNLYRNVLWLRTDVLALDIYKESNSLGINMGAPFDILFMGHYKSLSPYGFGGLGLSVGAANENTNLWAGVNLGGGLGYEVSRGMQIFGEVGLRFGNNTVSTPVQTTSDWDFSIFLGAGARFAFIW